MKFHFVILLLLLITSCGENVKEYYFFEQDLSQPKVYFYACEENSEQSEYWKITRNNNVITTEVFNSNFEKFEVFIEEQKENGSHLKEHTIINDNKSSETEVVNTEVFLWNSKESYSYAFKYFYQGNEILFRKIRSFSGFEERKVMGTSVNALKLEDTYQFSNLSTGDQLKFTQQSYYSKEFGFIGYKRNFGDGTTKTLKLTEIISSKEFQKRKAEFESLNSVTEND